MATKKTSRIAAKTNGSGRETRTRRQSSLAAKSPLAAFGYRVGTVGQSKSHRQTLLHDFVFAYEVGDEYPEDYAALWGEQGSHLRVARTIAQLTVLKTINKNKAEYAQSILDWEEDIEYLV